MFEKYSLEKMLKEIVEDEEFAQEQSKTRLSQEDIRAMLKKRGEAVKEKS